MLITQCTWWAWWNATWQEAQMQHYDEAMMQQLVAKQCNMKQSKTPKWNQQGGKHLGLIMTRLDTLPNMEVLQLGGVTTLLHYKRISSRDLGLKELRIFVMEVVLTFPGGFSVEMVWPLHFQEFDWLVASLAFGFFKNSNMMQYMHDMRDVICDAYACSGGKGWIGHQLGKPSIPLERWYDFGRNRYKDHRERMHGLQMASKTRMTRFCD